jgi:hypothetical protein
MAQRFLNQPFLALFAPFGGYKKVKRFSPDRVSRFKNSCKFAPFVPTIAHEQNPV